jgi:hypothetical protein
MNSDIPGVTLVPAVPRASWHRADDVWQCQAPSGQLASSRAMPTVRAHNRPVFNHATGRMLAGPGWSVFGDTFALGPVIDPPADHTATLRRIVDENLDERLRLEQMLVTDLRL